MLKTHMAACMLATGLIAAPALAQTSTTAPATNVAPVTTPAGPAGSTMGANPNTTIGANSGTNTTVNTNMNAANVTMANGTFMTQREPGMYRASELIGKDVRGANNEDIGEVGDVLIDRSGQVKAVVLDIGGFLGLGETHVAVPMQSLQFRSERQDANTTGSVGGTSTSGMNTTGTSGPMGTPGQNTAAGTSNNQNQANATRGGPEMIMLVMTKEQLQSAPRFEDTNRASNAGRTTGTATGTTAPRP